MDDRNLKLTAGSLFHDIGKVIHRTGDINKHSKSGHDFVAKDLQITDAEVLEQVKYHHYEELKKAKIPENSLAFITYIADNIAAGVERREREEVEKGGFNRTTALESVFNILNHSTDSKGYPPLELKKALINYPREKGEIVYDSNYYKTLERKLKENLKDHPLDSNYINSLIEILEAFTSYVPSSTNNKELADISLFEHTKLTAAVATSIYKYLNYKEISDYKTELLEQANSFYEKKTFLLVGLDISGIQKFIYSVTSKQALKGLRARSFYLEILLEHINDELLEVLELPRVNIIYSGGGHSYILTDNTHETKETLKKCIEEVNQWLLKYFDVDLYLAYGFSEASANDFKNKPEGTYKSLFQNVSSMISKNKMQRYSPREILQLNEGKEEDNTRECTICKRSDFLTDGDLCEICSQLNAISNDIKREDFLIITKEKPMKNYLKLPGDKYLMIQSEDTLRSWQKKQEFVRAYCKNEAYAGYKVATKIWVGDYNKKEGDLELTIEDLGKKALGIKRVAVLRADVDNLGQAFVSGFERKTEETNKYVTITRTATLSKRLSTFFKLHINELLENGEFFIEEREDKERNGIIVYSGGDDLFIVGAWDDVIGIAIDIRNHFKKYTQNTLTLSAGVGIYNYSYPISAMAKEVGELEDFSKEAKEKNAITLFEEGEEFRFDWDTLEKKVLKEKYSTVKELIGSYEEAGNATLYKLLELLRNQEDSINIARLAYQLARLEPKTHQKEYKRYSKKIYQWAKSKEDKNQLIMAIYIYVYANRKGEV